MKLSIIHNLYHRNEFVNQSTRLNIMALESSGIDYQYILFNDKGDKDIKKDIKEFLDNPNVEYVYSKVNYGRKMCPGGWIGALPYVKGELLQSTDQDDVMTTALYKLSLKVFEENPDIYMTHTNCFIVNQHLEIISSGINPAFTPDYSKPLDMFKLWFGIEEPLNQVTRANNNVMHAGTIYRLSLHDAIGLPDIKFRGAYDFEYWARILFNEYKCQFINLPLWLYRKSQYSAGNEIIQGKKNRGTAENPGWQQLNIQEIKDKYFKLWEEKKKS